MTSWAQKVNSSSLFRALPVTLEFDTFENVSSVHTRTHAIVQGFNGTSSFGYNPHPEQDSNNKFHKDVNLEVHMSNNE